MQVKYQLKQLTRRIARTGIGNPVQRRHQRVDAGERLLQPWPLVVAHDSACRPTPNIGECTVFKVLPLPRYMWTPHGRHGSKLRTVRIMSMPLKFSGPFSSKIGVFCTASSYGPGVP